MPVIYKILSPSNKVYIGETWNYSKRFSNYRKLKCESLIRNTKILTGRRFSNTNLSLVQD